MELYWYICAKDSTEGADGMDIVGEQPGNIYTSFGSVSNGIQSLHNIPIKLQWGTN